MENHIWNKDRLEYIKFHAELLFYILMIYAVLRYGRTR